MSLKNYNTWLKVVLSFAFIAIFLFFIGLDNIEAAFAELSIVQMIYASFFTLLVSCCQSARLYSLVFDWVNSYASLVKVGLIGQFFSNFLPGGFSGDIYKAVAFKKESNKQYMESIAILLLDRIAGLMATIILFSWSVFFVTSIDISFQRLLLLCSLMVGGSFIIWLIFNKLPVFVIEKLTLVKGTIACLTKQQMQNFVLLNIVVGGSRFVKFFVITWSVGIELSIPEVAFLVFAVHVATLLPLSIGGYGLLEGAITVVLIHFGVDSEIAFLAALLNRLGIWFCSILGCLFYSKKIF